MQLDPRILRGKSPFDTGTGVVTRVFGRLDLLAQRHLTGNVTARHWRLSMLSAIHGRAYRRAPTRKQVDEILDDRSYLRDLRRFRSRQCNHWRDLRKV